MLSEKELAKLVERTKAGDMDAFGSLYRETNRRVYFICLHFMKEQQEAEDMMQEAYLAAFKGLKELREPERFRGWVEQIAVNHCKNRLGKKLPIPMEEETSGVLKEESENILPEEYVTNQEKRRIVLDIMRQSLSDVQYQTVLLYYFNNLTIEEIAELMECPAGTVKYRLSVSRAKIKKGVEAYEHKTHDKLYSFAGVPFLALLLSEEAKACEVPELTEQVMGAVRELGAAAQTTRAGAAANRAGAQLTDVAEGAGNAAAEAAKETAGNAAKGVANGAAKAVTTGTADNVIGTAGKEIGKMAAKGFLSSTAAKIAIGAAVVVVGAGAAAAVIHNNKQTGGDTYPVHETQEAAQNVIGKDTAGGDAHAEDISIAETSSATATTETAGQTAVEAQPPESIYDESILGYIENGNRYVNEYFGITADLDSTYWELEDYYSLTEGKSYIKKSYAERLADYDIIQIFSTSNFNTGQPDAGFFHIDIRDESTLSLSTADPRMKEEIVPKEAQYDHFRTFLDAEATSTLLADKERVLHVGTIGCGRLDGYYYVRQHVNNKTPEIRENIFLYDNSIWVEITISPRSYKVESMEELYGMLHEIEAHLNLRDRVETEVITGVVEKNNE